MTGVQTCALPICLPLFLQKKSLKEKRQAAQEAKALKAKKAATSTTEAGRVGDRPYARGRSYKEDRYDDQ